MRILVIDDEFVSLSKMIAMVKPFGQCDAAANGQQATDRFCKALKEGKPYGLVTIDINLPDVDGINLLEILQGFEQQHNAPRAKKLMVTAKSTTSNVLEASSKKCDGFLVKPVRIATFLEKLTALGIQPETSVEDTD